ncbi:MAG TPA: helix-turn-helix transcriptional regulator [Terriglobales bacterium]|nr:helix-turn-helix transcriptional regulator [Terriglobales bacterium]
MLNSGQRLRALREQLGLTIRDVETASTRIAERHGNQEFAVALSRLSDIETKGIVPSIYRLYSLAIIYRRDFRELLSWYGVDLDLAGSDAALAEPPRSHATGDMELAQNSVRMPVRLDPSFDLTRTSNLSRMVERWASVPLAYLAQFENSEYTYGYIGAEDFTMYPLLMPGSFLQVDESRNKVVEGMWRTEYERPIYFVETREGHTCCWCSVKRDSIVLQPHPLSPVAVRIMRHPQDAEVIGQVVGVAMRLGDWRPLPSSPASKAQLESH